MARLLKASPDEAYCAACLAFALEISLLDAQTVAAQLAQKSSRYHRRSASCATCGRTVDTIGWVTP